jgi:diguanylate cyclase (GGDEF)-like protein/PAS domain S-box-containing protein
MNRFLMSPRLWWVPVLGWALLVSVSLLWNLRSLDDDTRRFSEERARFVFRMVESVRLWNLRRGHVYTTVDPADPPSAYLNDPEREVVTPSGRRLTRVDPGYVTRQLAGVMQEVARTRVHLTGLGPLNPANGPDPWETEALRSFALGARTRFALVEGDEGMEVRYMAPVVTERQCLACHARQGYKEGDVLGGVAVRFSAADLFAAAAAQREKLLATHAAAWLLLSMLTSLALSRVRNDMVFLSEAKQQQDALVERRTAELRDQMREREAAEARLRLLVESSGEGIYGLDTDGRITFVNSRALRLLGYEHPDEVLGQEAHGLWQALPLLPAARVEFEGLAGLHLHREDETFRRADGSAISVEYRVAPLVMERQVVGAVVTFDDITERKQREHELRKLSSAIEHSPESVVITNVNGVIEYVNRKFEETTGYAAAEIIGRTPSLLKSGRTRAEVYQELWQTITSGQVWQGAILNRKRNGELFWEEESISPITDDRGTITHFVGVKEDITERRRLEEKIWRQANFDSLTDLPNRSLFYDRLQQALARAQRDGAPLALMYIDLDGFKEVNDRLGHTAGDQLLREAARRLLRGIRRADTVARMGGDEFTVILTSFEHGSDMVKFIAERMREALAKPFSGDSFPVTISASIGVAFYPADGDSMEKLLQHADIAMYRAKERGRNSVVFFGEDGVES